MIPPTTQPGVTYVGHEDHILVTDTLAKGKPTWVIPIKRKGPGFLKRAKNFAAAAAAHATTGMKSLTDEEVDARYAVCEKCPSDLLKVADANSGRCLDLSCGCPVANSKVKSGRNKARWAEQRCTKGHWDGLRIHE